HELVALAAWRISRVQVVTRIPDLQTVLTQKMVPVKFSIEGVSVRIHPQTFSHRQNLLATQNRLSGLLDRGGLLEQLHRLERPIRFIPLHQVPNYPNQLHRLQIGTNMLLCFVSVQLPGLVHDRTQRIRLQVILQAGHEVTRRDLLSVVTPPTLTRVIKPKSNSSMLRPRVHSQYRSLVVNLG